MKYLKISNTQWIGDHTIYVYHTTGVLSIVPGADQAPVPLSIFRSNSWRVQNIVVIGRVYYTLECFEFSSNFELDRNMLSGTGAMSTGHDLWPDSVLPLCIVVTWLLATIYFRNVIIRLPSLGQLRTPSHFKNTINDGSYEIRAIYGYHIRKLSFNNLYE